MLCQKILLLNLILLFTAEGGDLFETTPVLGWWATWGTWSTCVGLCEEGMQSRSRKCPGGDCPGNDTEAVACDIERYCIDGGWSVWGPYAQLGVCSKPCGAGTVVGRRSRLCERSHEGCSGPTSKDGEIACNIHPCYVNGQWGDWEAWVFSNCSTSCGFGIISKSRRRLCINPQPSGGGKFCVGDAWQSYQISCQNDVKCPTTTPTTPEHLPEEHDYTIIVTLSVIFGVPVMFGIYITIGAMVKAFCCKKNPKQYAPESASNVDDSHEQIIAYGGHRIDLPNDGWESRPPDPKIWTTVV